MRLLFLVLCLLLTFCWTPEARSQKGADPAAPIRIEADRMETFQEKNIVLFSGNVRANQDELTIHADEMTVQYTGAGAELDPATGIPPEPGREIETIKATGNVKIVQREWIAAGDSMDFNATARIVILSGNAKAWQKQNMVSGEKIILYLDEGRSIVESSTSEGERVKAFIYPAAPEKKDAENPQNK